MRDAIIKVIMDMEDRSPTPFIWSVEDQNRHTELCDFDDDILIETLANVSWDNGLKAGKAAGPNI